MARAVAVRSFAILCALCTGMMATPSAEQKPPPPQPSAAAAIVKITPPATDQVTVVFSAPINDEASVRLDTKIRIQFSTDIDAASLKDRLRINYSESDSVERGEAEPPKIPFSIKEVPGHNAIELMPDKPLERFREVEVELLDGIKARDGSTLKPWSLKFTTGGS